MPMLFVALVLEQWGMLVCIWGWGCCHHEWCCGHCWQYYWCHSSGGGGGGLKKEATTQFVTAASCSDLHVRSPAEDLTPRILPCPMEFHCLFCRILTSPAEPQQTGHGIIRLNCCTISFNLAPSVMCYQLAKISISAGPGFKHDIQIFSTCRV